MVWGFFGFKLWFYWILLLFVEWYFFIVMSFFEICFLEILIGLLSFFGYGVRGIFWYKEDVSCVLYLDLFLESYVDIIVNNFDCLLILMFVFWLLSFVFIGYCCIWDFEIFWGVIFVIWWIEELVLWGF